MLRHRCHMAAFHPAAYMQTDTCHGKYESCVCATGTTPESNVNEAMEAAAAAVEREGKSVLDALKDLHTHFGAGAAAGGAAANVVEGPPRLGKVRRC